MVEFLPGGSHQLVGGLVIGGDLPQGGDDAGQSRAGLASREIELPDRVQGLGSAAPTEELSTPAATVDATAVVDGGEHLDHRCGVEGVRPSGPSPLDLTLLVHAAGGAPRRLRRAAKRVVGFGGDVGQIAKGLGQIGVVAGPLVRTLRCRRSKQPWHTSLHSSYRPNASL